MTVIGAYARIDRAHGSATIECLDALEGVTTFPLPDPDRLGVLVEADDVDRARDILLHQVATTRGVLGTWSISVHEDWNDEPEAHEDFARKACEECTP